MRGITEQNIAEHVNANMDIKWEKVLYKTHPGIPDNYTDEKFLEGLKHNVHFKPVQLKTALAAATRVSAQLSIVVLFFVVFTELKYQADSAESVFLISSMAVSCGYAAFLRISAKRRYVEHAKSVIYFVVIGYASTPVLRTLTNTISTDTIYAMTAMLMMIHLLSHHYGMDAACVSPYLSLNAALCGAICLASRLESTTQAFVLLTVAVEAFALFPGLYEAAKYPLGLSLLVAAVSFLSVCIRVPVASTVLFLATLCFINVLCPLLFVWAQSYKKNIHGPWDEAMIR